jgi:hypothetical protein
MSAPGLKGAFVRVPRHVAEVPLPEVLLDHLVVGHDLAGPDQSSVFSKEEDT